ncbi:Dynein heavy chain 14, axonemal [Varanus komodoensis]|nr:Dynein heavy chain 14, axonemal [Varanus komodoensis]
MWTENYQKYRQDFEEGEELEIKLPTYAGSWRKLGNFRKTSTSASLTMLKPLIVWITTNCSKFLKRWEYQTILFVSGETYMRVKKQQAHHEKGGLDESPVGIKLAGRNINNFRYADDTILMAESEEELKSLLMQVKEESAKIDLKLNIKKTKIMASGPLTSWQIDGEEMEVVTDFIFLGSKITADGDCSQEIKRRLLLGRKAMTNLDSILKSRDITLPTKVRIVKAMVFPVAMYGCESWTIRKAERQRIEAFELWCWRKLLRVPWTTRNKKKKFSAVEEIFIMFSVLKEVNLPKFLAEDVLLFEDIMKDLFPEMRVPKVSLKRLEGAISLAIQLLGLQPWESQIAKVIQFYNQIVACVGVMLVGPTGGGKTTIRSILEKALMVLPLMEMDSGTKIDVVLNSLKKGKVDTFVINPKCVTLGELFGETNTSTMEWSDGLLSSAVRTFARLAGKKPKKKEPGIGTNSEMQDLYTLNTVTTADAILTDETQPTENTRSVFFSGNYQKKNCCKLVPHFPLGCLYSDRGFQQWSHYESHHHTNLGFLCPKFSYSVSFLTHIAGNSNKCVCTRVCVFVCLFVLDEAITDWQWIILDGPVDPSWIENLNSVLDDTRMLCLANGERIYLSPGIRMVFEVDSLSQASPATVSRCAMVYVDPVDLGWEPYVKTWLEGFSEIIAQSDMEYLESLFHSSIKGGMDFLNKHKNMQAFPVHQMGIVMNICRIVGSFIHIIKESGGLQISKYMLSKINV